MSKKINKNWVIASSNLGKITELNKLLVNNPVILLPQSNFKIEDIEETGCTFIENALLKARHASKLAKLPAIADDSGLVVPCLNNEPGIYSARYANTGNAKDNIAKLIANLKDLSSDSGARFPAYFYCLLVLLQSPMDPTPIIAQGRWHGFIVLEPKGDNGFGYDPIFLDPELNLTVAEMSPEQKQARSHRGKALASLILQD